MEGQTDGVTMPLLELLIAAKNMKIITNVYNGRSIYNASSLYSHNIREYTKFWVDMNKLALAFFKMQ